jgi:hypothetical protein
MKKLRRLTPRQQLFAYSYVEFKNAVTAYKMAYSTDGWTDNAITVDASRVLRHTAVSLKIDELLNEHREAHGVTVDTLAREYDAAISQASSLGKSSAVIAGLTGKAKLFGLAIDNQKISGSLEFKPPAIEFAEESTDEPTDEPTDDPTDETVDEPTDEPAAA